MILEEQLLCVWKQMANKKESTTFQAVKDKSNPLYKCKYECDGKETNDCYHHMEIERDTYKRD